VTPAVDGDPLLVETLTRLRAELALAGMRAITDGVASDGAAPAVVITIARAAASPDSGAVTVEVRVKTPGDRAAVIRQATVTTERGAGDASVLAIRAVELLHATLMQVAATEAAPATAAPPVARASMPSSSSPTERWGIALGAALLQSVAGFGSAFGPAVCVALHPTRSFALGFEAAGPTFSRDLTAATGSASLRQELGLASARWTLGRARRVAPVLSAGVGVYHVHVAGTAAGGGQATTRALWTPMASAGLGLAVALAGPYAVQIDATTLFLKSSPFVEIGSADAGHAGRPLLLFSLTVGRGFSRGAFQ
jgi:hypothetical protein